MPLDFLSPIHKASRQIGIHLGPRVDALGIPSSDAHVLSFLRHYAPCAIGRVQRVFGLRPSTLTSLLDRLENRGMIRREAHPEDRRSTLIKTTVRGRALGDAIDRHVLELEKEIRNRITEKDIEGFKNVMTAIAGATNVTLQQEEKSS